MTTNVKKARETVVGEPASVNLVSRPGTYALLLASDTNADVQVGRLGCLHLQPGYYVYIGSALGPGGVRARVLHHVRFAKRPHWHIDYLRRHTSIKQIWFCYDKTSREHRWARRFAKTRGASVPLAGFGSSDCNCESHLFFFSERPPWNPVIAALPSASLPNSGRK